MSFLPDPNPVDLVNWQGQAQPQWVSMVPYFNATNWAQYDASTYPAYFAKDSMGFVHTRGLVKSVAAYAFATPATLIIATLPPFLRPVSAHVGMFMQQDTTPSMSLIRLDVQTTGVIQLLNQTLAGASNNGNAAFGRFILEPWYAPLQV